MSGMKVNLPLYIFEQRAEGLFTVRPLFLTQPSVIAKAQAEHQASKDLEVSHKNLHKALEKLNLELRKRLRELGKQARHEALAALVMAPHVRAESLKLELYLRRRSLKLRLLMLSFELQGRKVVMSPQIPELWFLLERGKQLALEAEAVYTAWFRQLESADPSLLQGSRWGLGEKDHAWISELELEFSPRQALPKAMDLRALMALFSSQEKGDGEAELDSVGRCLNWLYPDGLTPAIGREAEKAQLLDWLQHLDKRPVVVIGPAGVGKTSLVHACVAEMTRQRRNQWGSKQNIWQLAPQRLISGMSYVGQWEERLLAILETAVSKDLTLFFDDLPGLFSAGQSADSSLNVAQILRAWIEERKVRVLAEATPEAWQLVTERDRGLADQFTVLQLQTPSEAESLPMLLELMRQLEAEQRCQFLPQALLLMMQLLQRFVRDSVLPGKAARLLRQLASRYPKQEIGREQVLEAFGHFSGLSLELLETEKPLRRDDIIQALQQRVMGQRHVIELLSERVSLARARLNDPERPLVSFLFLGPTGVGKTECAKALAEYLYGSEERLLRFDMNEYGTAYAVQRLIGTWHEPEGLLTSAVRRQPFAVLLFDEIEKADPAVYDLLLQVLGEGRLTDARGRTADFTQTLIILTSNLGVRESRQNLGFGSGTAADAAQQVAYQSSFVKTAEAFFRPEFFNRLDGIVPFDSLSREEIGQIAALLIAKLFAREGLVRRRSMLRIQPAAMEQVVELGYHPQLGARALKRALERQLAQPVGMALAEMLPETPTLITVLAGQPELQVRVQPLSQPEPKPFADVWQGRRPKELWQALLDWSRSLLAESSGRQAEQAAQGQEQAYHQLMLRQFWHELRESLQDLSPAFESQALQTAGHLGFKTRQMRHGRVSWKSERMDWQNLFAAHDLNAALLELLHSYQDTTPALKARLEALAARCSLFLTLQASQNQTCGRWLVVLKAADEHSVNVLAQQARLLKHALQQVPGLDCEQLEELHRLDRRCLLVEGLHAPALLSWEQGLHLHVGSDNRMMPIELTYQAFAEPLELDDSAEFTRSEVIRLYHAKGPVLDWRSGDIWELMPGPEDLFETWLRLLDPPAELIGAGL